MAAIIVSGILQVALGGSKRVYGAVDVRMRFTATWLSRTRFRHLGASRRILFSASGVAGQRFLQLAQRRVGCLEGLDSVSTVIVSGILQIGSRCLKGVRGSPNQRVRFAPGVRARRDHQSRHQNQKTQ
jgi:hypothetical protein